MPDPTPVTTNPGQRHARHQDGPRVVLVNPYELGRQSFTLAEATARLQDLGCEVVCIELAQQRLSAETLTGADVVALSLGMHTATRIAIKALPRIRSLAPDADICAFGLYAPMNAEHLRGHGVEPIVADDPGTGLANRVRSLQPDVASRVDNGPQPARHLPERGVFPALTNYAQLVLPDGRHKVVGFTDTTRGCKHLCRHCPIVPVYQGRFRAIPMDTVMADIRQQVAAGAQHISFGDADFLNGPTHALRITRALAAAFPGLTFDATIKIQHLQQQASMLTELKTNGLLFVTSAVESIDDTVLEHLDKHHTRRDFEQVVDEMRAAGIALAPTFVPFTPWTSLEGYIELLKSLLELRLVASVPPIQLGIRLLVPAGSYLLELEDLWDRLSDFDAERLGYPWQHADARLDHLQQAVMAEIEAADRQGDGRAETFERIWRLAHRAAELTPPTLAGRDFGAAIPAMTENWYCCAEPTHEQLQGF